MKILSRVIDRVKSVYQYEKTTRIDAGAIQNVMIIFAIVMMLINIQNFRLGEYFVTALTLVVSGISIFAILALGYSYKIYVICMASVVIFLILSIPISLLGLNRGFALLWYFLMPIVSIVLLGMPFGIPVSGSFGCREKSGSQNASYYYSRSGSYYYFHGYGVVGRNSGYRYRR